MESRYLYADSEPFPEQYDFLATLKGFIGCVGRAGVLHHEIRGLEEELARSSSDRGQKIAELTAFCEAITQDIRDRAMNAASAVVSDEATKIEEAVAQTLTRATGRHEEERKQEQARISAQIESKRTEIWKSLEQFMTNERLSVTSSRFSMRLLPTGASLRASIASPSGITACYELDPHRSGEWGVPRRVADFAPGVNVQVGMKRKFLRKTYEPEVVLLDDYIISGVNLEENACELRLRRRSDTPSDALIVRMWRADGEVSVRVSRQEPAEDNEPHDVEIDDVSKLLQLWHNAEERSHAALPHKVRLHWLRLDGADVLENDLLIPLFERLVDLFAPMAREIARRSPSQAELSLKIQRTDGRREEIYVNKQDLCKPLYDLPSSLFQKFNSLEIFPKRESKPPVRFESVLD